MSKLPNIDLSEIEKKIALYLEDDYHINNIFRGGLDAHTFTASDIFGIKQEEVTDDQRKFAKSVNHALAYRVRPEVVVNMLKAFLKRTSSVQISN